MTLQFQLAIAALVAALSFGSGWAVNGWRGAAKLEDLRAEIARIHAVYDKERLAAQEQLALAVQNNRQAEQHMQAVADQERLKTNEQINAASHHADSLVVRVRNAEAAAATARLVSSSTQTTCVGQTASGGIGAELLGSLGSEDVREAERADKIRIALRTCYAQYDAARAQFVE